ncbi:hypothetical protein [Stutzerimonas kirkiae]|uniref:hypothetical protein n=1 Tax=Stutzerimonas kirkiae TaxID=2211392 RepID=UPI0010382FCF|nr:hypothetical protein [Stutzerimonas kirkiae]TBV07485.1 hypothetical protein DNK08_12375 [Stutzerimonas kirkiae]TBV15726.1 hypothetical protein DNK01_05375 [Stutzerimonas kirkiae]
MTPFNSLRTTLGLGALFALPMAQADYLWIERSAGQPAKAYLSEFQPGEHLDLGKLREPAVRLAEGKGEAPRVEANGYLISAPVAGDLRLQAKLPEGGKLVIYEAKEGRGETKAVNDLELVPTTPGGNTFKLHWKGSVVSASQVNVYTSEQWNRTLKPAEDGSVTLDPVFPARYVLEVTAEVNGAATVEGKRYESVVHVATLSFDVPR